MSRNEMSVVNASALVISEKRMILSRKYVFTRIHFNNSNSMTYRGQKKKLAAPATLVPSVTSVHVENILFHTKNFPERNTIMKKPHLW